MAYEIIEGMTVRSPSGEKLGKIDRIGDGTFTIEKGLFNKERHEARFSDVIEVRDGDAIINADWSERGAGLSEESRAARGTTETTAIPLREEELDVTKRQREAGDVVVTKSVETEEETLTVPVRKERVRVERAPATEMRAAEGDLSDETIRVPVREEEIEVTKRPVVREELRVSKEAYEEERQISEPLRRERADVRTEGEIKGPMRGEPDDKY